MTGFDSTIRLGPIGPSPPGLVRFPRPAGIAFRSAPAQKVPWLPPNTATRAASSPSNSRKAAARAAAVSRSTAFRTSGRLIITVVTLRVFSTSTGIPPPSGLQAGLDVPDLFDYKAAPDGFHFEVLCRSGVVPVDLAAQQIQRLEFHLASQPVQEPDRQAFAVDLSVKVHYVGLDGYLAVAAQGWPMANVGNRPAPLSPDRGKGHIHSVGRNYLILGPQVGRSISELRLSQL